MNKIMKFENTPINIQIINGIPMFELYSVGMALGQVKKNSKGTIYPAKDRIDKNAENAEIQPCVRNVHKYIKFALFVQNRIVIQHVKRIGTKMHTFFTCYSFSFTKYRVFFVLLS